MSAPRRSVVAVCATVACVGFLLSFGLSRSGELQRSPQSSPDRTKFARAMEFSGDNINTGVFLGMLAGAQSMGKPIDVVVASCGGSIAAAIAHSIPEDEPRLELIRSKPFYENLRKLKMNEIGLGEFVPKLFGLVWERRRHTSSHEDFEETCAFAATSLPGLSRDPRCRLTHRVPDVFSFALIDVRSEFELPAFQRPFSTQGTRAVIVASRLEFGKDDVGKDIPHTQKLFTEVLFTDPGIAPLLAGFPSKVGSKYPESALNPYTETISDATLAQAVRASVADPLLTAPALIRGRHYMTGAVNIDPVNVAEKIAHEVIARYPGPYDPVVEQSALMATFKFDGNQVRGDVLKGSADYWIDTTGADYPAMTPGPKLSWKRSEKLIRFGSNVPESYEEYLQVVEAQYRFGFDRAVEALEQQRNSQAHIREPFSR